MWGVVRVRPHLKTLSDSYHAQRGDMDGRLMPSDLILVGLEIASPNMHGENTVSLTPGHSNEPNDHRNASAGFSTLTSASSNRCASPANLSVAIASRFAA